MTDHEYWAVMPPQSQDGWNQLHQERLARLYDRLSHHEQRLNTHERALWDIHRKVDHRPGHGEQKATSMGDTVWTVVRANAWKIGLAIFLAGGAYAKAGLPSPLGILQGFGLG